MQWTVSSQFQQGISTFRLFSFQNLIYDFEFYKLGLASNLPTYMHSNIEDTVKNMQLYFCLKRDEWIKDKENVLMEGGTLFDGSVFFRTDV